MPITLVKHIKSLVVAVSLFLISCTDVVDNNYVEVPVEKLYNQAYQQLKDGDYNIAGKSFDEVERQHPYSVWAIKAHLMSAYCSYQLNEYDDVIISLDRFIQLHPSNRDTPYAYYLKALSYYEQISDVRRDQQMTKEAMKTMKELVVRFPGSKYARDVTLKIDLTKDHLAGKEMEIGRYYANKGMYLAAINRFIVVTDNYQSTTHVPEALHRLTESYLALGLVDQARKTAAILGHNFPGSEWYVDTYNIVENKKAKALQKPTEKWYWPFD